MQRSDSRWIAAVALVALAACGGDDSNPIQVITPQNGTMTATVDGNAWRAP